MTTVDPRISSMTMAHLTRRSLFIWLFTLVLSASAHEHHDELSEEEAHAPIDAILWLHICVQALVWGVLFPTGMVLGLSRSRWHVPLQVSLLPFVPLGYHEMNCIAERRLSSYHWRLHFGPFTWWTRIPPWGPRHHGQHHAHPYRSATGSRNLPQAPYPRT